MATGIRKTGEFCWINMLTPQPPQAREFFGKLLGWTYTDVPGMDSGNIIQVNGHNIGGLWDLESPMTPPGTPPAIGVMVKIDSADDMVKKVTALGGTANPPMDIMENGRMVGCVDPNGAVIDLWEAKNQPGMDGDSTQHGAPSWFETLTTDAARAREFYSELFGWTSEDQQMPGFKYTTFSLGSEPVAGMFPLTPEMGEMPPHWATYFTVDDPDKTAERVTELGGSVFMPLMDIDGVGRMAGVSSPQGVMFYVIKYFPMT